MTTGTFMTPDPWGEAGSGTNLTLYVKNEFTDATDPSGKELVVDAAGVEGWKKELATWNVHAVSTQLPNGSYYLYIPENERQNIGAFFRHYWKGDDGYNRIVLNAATSTGEGGPWGNLFGTGNQEESTGIGLQNQFPQGSADLLAVSRFATEQRGTTSGATLPEKLTVGEGVSEFAKGASQGAVVVANELTFHAIDSLNKTAEQLIAENPILADSALCGSIARETLTTALTAGAASVVLKGGTKLGGVIVRQLPGKLPCIVQTAGKTIQTGYAMYLTAETVVEAGQAAEAAYEVLNNPNASPHEAIKKLTDAGLALVNLGYSAKDLVHMAQSMSKQGFKKFFASCFAAGTEILTDRGWVAIEDVKVGDKVWSRSEEGPDSPLVLLPVGKTITRLAVVLELRVAGRMLRVTAEHPFWARGRGWVKAGELRRNDALAGRDQEWLAVDGISETGEQVPVYNFSVPGSKTYFVGGADWGFAVWVHNSEQCIVAGNSKEVQEAVVTPKGPYRGGPHSETSLPKNDGYDSHHMPAKSVSGIDQAQSRGPAIKMDPKDHARTSSNGQMKGSEEYRDQIGQMIENDNMRGAMAKEIKDVRRAAQEVSGNRTKYNEAMQEMMQYAKQEGIVPPNPNLRMQK